MCTGVCWDWHCRACCTVIVRDTHVSGHTCREAERAGKKGCCRTGVEYSRFSKLSADLCALCETKDEIAKIDAFTCETGASEKRVGYYIPTGNDGYEEIMEYTPEQLKEWDEWKEPLSSDEESDDDDEEEEKVECDCFSGTTYSVAEASTDDDEKTGIDEKTDIDDDDEDGGAKLQQKMIEQRREAVKAEIRIRYVVPWDSFKPSVWRQIVWSFFNRRIARDMVLCAI